MIYVYLHCVKCYSYTYNLVWAMWSGVGTAPRGRAFSSNGVWGSQRRPAFFIIAPALGTTPGAGPIARP